jgi:hypothetical protein
MKNAKQAAILEARLFLEEESVDLVYNFFAHTDKIDIPKLLDFMLLQTMESESEITAIERREIHNIVYAVKDLHVGIEQLCANIMAPLEKAMNTKSNSIV